MAGPRPTIVDELQVLEAIAAFWVKHDRGPTIRELKEVLGYFGTGRLHDKIMRLVQVGVVAWPYKGQRREYGGIRLAVRIIRPVRVPVVGYINIASDFVPGERWIEFHPDGRITTEGGVECTAFLP